jgi:hypothetical protein
VAVHDAIRHKCLVTPGRIKQLAAAQDAAALLNERLEQFELKRGDLNDLLAAADLAAGKVDRNISKAVHIGRRRFRPPEERPDARPQFARAEELCDVVIRAEIQSHYFFRFLRLGRKHDDRGANTGPAQLAVVELEFLACQEWGFGNFSILRRYRVIQEPSGWDFAKVIPLKSDNSASGAATSEETSED